MFISKIKYNGDGNQQDTSCRTAWNQPEKYQPDDRLKEAVNMALHLRRPLLLEGAPGAGKTRLAYAVAYELGWPLHTCYVRSVSQTGELLYEFDQLKRLYDIQTRCAMPNGTQVNAEGPTELPDLKSYLRYRPLGQAIKDAAEENQPSVVLIDEIDKADIDFPNDLLQVLEEWRFRVNEIDEEVVEVTAADAAAQDQPRTRPLEIDALNNEPKEDRMAALPLVIITSNREKDLPSAFLRRCLYYFIEFPEKEKLLDILKAHMSDRNDERTSVAIDRFLELRGDQNRLDTWRKAPGSSELIDWTRWLEIEDIPIDRLKNCKVIELPGLEALVKHPDDRTLLKADAGNGSN